MSWLITIFHEFGHFLATVKLQIPVHLKLNLRMIFLRTDFYLVLLNFLGVSTLHDNAIELIKEFFFQKKISRTDNKIKIYLVIYIFGLIFSTVYFVYNIFIYVNIIILAKSQFFNHTASSIDMFFLAVLLISSIFIWLIGFINKINEIGRK